MRKEIIDYIEKTIIPRYENNYIGDDKERINYVQKRSETIIKENNLEINPEILYVAIAYHDIRKNNEEKNHEKISAEIMYNDENLKQFLTEEERTIIKEAIEDQRANKQEEPRNIYGKILSSASRNTKIEQTFKRSYLYGKKKNPNLTEDEIFENAYEALKNKFGHDGYAKFYFKDTEYEQFLKDIRKLLEDKDNFIKQHKEYIEGELK